MRLNQVRSDQVRPGQIRWCQVRSNQARPCEMGKKFHGHWGERGLPVRERWAPPRGPGNSRARGVRPSYCAFFAMLVTFFLDWFLLDVWPQLASRNPQKSIKNPCQDAFPCWTPFLIDFWSILAPNLDPPNPKNHWNYIGFICIVGFAALST